MRKSIGFDLLLVLLCGVSFVGKAHGQAYGVTEEILVHPDQTHDAWCSNMGRQGQGIRIRRMTFRPYHQVVVEDVNPLYRAGDGFGAPGPGKDTQMWRLNGSTLRTQPTGTLTTPIVRNLSLSQTPSGGYQIAVVYLYPSLPFHGAKLGSQRQPASDSFDSIIFLLCQSKERIYNAKCGCLFVC